MNQNTPTVQSKIEEVLKEKWLQHRAVDGPDFAGTAKAILALMEEEKTAPTVDSEGEKGYQVFQDWFEIIDKAAKIVGAPAGALQTSENIKHFIRQTIASVRTEERERVVKILEGIKIDVMNGGCGIKEHTHHKPENWTWNRAIKEAITAITNPTKEI